MFQLVGVSTADATENDVSNIVLHYLDVNIFIFAFHHNPKPFVTGLGKVVIPPVSLGYE